jgi:hypothetical protein
MIATLNGKSSQLLRTPDNIPAERSSSETGKSGRNGQSGSRSVGQICRAFCPRVHVTRHKVGEFP